MTASLLAGALAAACAAGDGSGVEDSSSANAGGGLGFDAGTSSTGMIDPDAACAKASDEAQLVPLNMYIMFDKSGSMSGVKWFDATSALQGFFEDPESAGLNVALRFFPDSGCDSSCSVSACSHPKVPLGTLTALSGDGDPHEKALFDAFVGVDPSGGTPLSAALDGAIEWAYTVQAQKPGEKVAVVLVTDGEPEDCELSGNYLVGQAGLAYNNGIFTFAIGLEGSQDSLIQGIAAAGGTTGYFIGGETDVKAQFAAALDEIRKSAVACEFVLPTEVDGAPVNISQVNVLFTPGGASEPNTIGNVPNAEACGGANGWYYDDPADPKAIILCEATCQSLGADQDASVEVLLGCATIPA